MLALALTAALVVPPPVNAPLPRAPAALRAAYARTTADLDVRIDAWTGRGALPRPLALDALYQERIVRFLAATPALASAVPAAAQDVVARADLLRLTTPYAPATRVRI